MLYFQQSISQIPKISLKFQLQYHVTFDYTIFLENENSKMKTVVTLQGPQEQEGLQERKDCRHSARRKYTDLNMENIGFENSQIYVDIGN